MKKEVTISYEWWNLEHDIKESHKEILEADAMERIIEMMEEGNTSGELHSYVIIDKEDGQDGVEYTGSWSINTKTL